MENGDPANASKQKPAYRSAKVVEGVPDRGDAAKTDQRSNQQRERLQEAAGSQKPEDLPIRRSENPESHQVPNAGQGAAQQSRSKRRGEGQDRHPTNDHVFEML